MLTTTSRYPHFSTRTDSAYWQCERKKGYATLKVARNAAGVARNKSGKPVEPYKCPHCSQFHIGKAPSLPLKGDLSHENTTTIPSTRP